MSNINGMFAVESVTEQDFDSVDDFFDMVVSKEVTHDKANEVAAITCLNTVTSDITDSDVNRTTSVNTTVDETPIVLKKNTEVSTFNTNKIDVVDQSISQETIFKPVDEVINDNIVIVPEEINITKYKGGTVLSREQVEQLSYPCVYIHADTLPAYKATALKAILSRGEFDGDSVIYVCYLEYKDTVMQLGYMDNKVMREMIRSSIFADLDVVVYLSENKQISGVYLNALCAV